MNSILKISAGLLLIAGMLTGCSESGASVQEEVYTSDEQSLLSDQGVDSQAYVLSEDVEQMMDSAILSSADEFTISFWIRPEANYLWTTLFSMGNDENHFIQLSTSGNPTGEQCGLNLTLKSGNKEDRILSDKEVTLETGVFNHVAVTVTENNAAVYYNGVKTAEGKVNASLKKIRSGKLIIGKSLFFPDPISKGVFQDLKVIARALKEEEILAQFDAVYPLMVLDTLHFNQSDDQRDNLWFGINPYRDLYLIYSSSDPQWITDQGKITLPTVEQGDQEVTITAKIEHKGNTFSKDFVFHLLADSEQTRMKRDLIAVRNDFQPLINENEILPEITEYGTRLEWTVVSGDIEIQDHRIIKKTEQEKVNATLKVTLKQGNLEESVQRDVVVLDEFTGYILSYFNGELGEERGKLAYSRDGLHWTDLNNGEPVLSSELGNGRIRDPFVGRDKEGNFVILATEGFDNPMIYIWKSKDLIDLTDHQLVPVSLWDPYLKMSGTRAWAPEMIYDPEKDLYYIVFSDPTEKDESALYYVSTKDFTEFSYPGNFFKPGYTVIDGTFLQNDGKYWMFYKDERKAAQTIYYAETDDLSEFFGKAYDDRFLFPLKYMEGPFVFKDIHEDKFYLYEDYYPYGTFHVAEFTHLSKDPDLRWLDENEFQLPNDDVRHGSAVAVTEKELQRILQAYQ